MAEQKVLVVYYSRTGTTRKVAEAVADILQCDIAEVIDKKDRSGVLGYLRSVKDAMRRKEAVIEPFRKDPADYDLVIIGTPVWAWSMSCPIRAYLSQCRERLPDVAFFCTTGSAGIKRTFRHMAQLGGKAPRAALGLKMKDVLKDRHTARVRNFTDELKG